MAMIQILNDESPMPFGKHRGKRMTDVPAAYLLWFRDTEPLPEHGCITVGNATYSGPPANNMRAEQKAVRMYIDGNMDVLKAEQKREKRNYMFNPYQ